MTNQLKNNSKRIKNNLESFQKKNILTKSKKDIYHKKNLIIPAMELHREITNWAFKNEGQNFIDSNKSTTKASDTPRN